MEGPQEPPVKYIVGAVVFGYNLFSEALDERAANELLSKLREKGVEGYKTEYTGL